MHLLRAANMTSASGVMLPLRSQTCACACIAKLWHVARHIHALLLLCMHLKAVKDLLYRVMVQQSPLRSQICACACVADLRMCMHVTRHGLMHIVILDSCMHMQAAVQ